MKQFLATSTFSILVAGIAVFAFIRNGNVSKKDSIGRQPTISIARSAASPIPNGVTGGSNEQVSGMNLIINSPQSNHATSQGSVQVEGITSPRAHVIVNEYELRADSRGSFSQRVSLDEGENYISVVAYTEEGAVAEKELLIVRE